MNSTRKPTSAISLICARGLSFGMYEERTGWLVEFDLIYWDELGEERLKRVRETVLDTYLSSAQNRNCYSVIHNNEEYGIPHDEIIAFTPPEGFQLDLFDEETLNT